MHILTWQKSTYSPDGSNCVEIAATPTTIHIRDSKNPTGPHLTLSAAAWSVFLSPRTAPREAGGGLGYVLLHGEAQLSTHRSVVDAAQPRVYRATV